MDVEERWWEEMEGEMILVGKGEGMRKIIQIFGIGSRLRMMREREREGEGARQSHENAVLKGERV